MNPNTPARQGGLPAAHTLIKVEDFPRLNHLTDETREKYRSGVQRLYEVLNAFPQDSPNYQNAYKKLVDVSIKIRQSMQVAKQDRDQASAQAAAAQQNGARPMSSGQPGQSDPRPQPQPTQGGGQSRQETYSQKVIQEVKRINIVAPPQLAAKGQEAARKWVLDAQNKYAQHLQSLESYGAKRNGIEQMIKRRSEMGNPLSQSEMASYSAELTRTEQNTRETKDFLSKFQLSQRDFKMQQAQIQAQYGGDGIPNGSQAPNISGQYAATNPGMGSQAQVKQEPQSQPHTVSSAVDAARNQTNGGARSAMSPQNNGQPGQPPMTQQPPVTRPQSHNPMTNPHPPLNVNTNTRPTDQQHNSPRVAPTQPSSIPQDPVPLSHQAAMEQARSYSHPNINQITPQSATHAHPQQDQRNQNNHAKMPIPKDLNLQPTQPVSMGPSRPTMTNGPNALGALGQPAIQRHPGYVLEGEGEHVLSKKKLEELVRQVTGGTGGEGEEGEALTAEVEEVRSKVTFAVLQSLLKTYVDSSLSRGRLCRPSHRRRLPSCQASQLFNLGASRSSTHSRAQLQHSCSWLRVGRASNRQEDRADSGMDSKAQRCPGR